MNDDFRNGLLAPMSMPKNEAVAAPQPMVQTESSKNNFAKRRTGAGALWVSFHFISSARHKKIKPYPASEIMMAKNRAKKKRTQEEGSLSVWEGIS